MEPNEFERVLSDSVGPLDYRWSELKYHLASIDNKISVPPTKPVDLNVTVIDSNEHVEGNWTTNLYVVLQVMHPDGSVQYFKKTGYYRSHEGAEWDGAMTEVHPETKTVTVWSDAEPEFDNSFGGLGWDA